VTALVGLGGVPVANAAAPIAGPQRGGAGITGTLMVAHGDNFATGAMIMQTELSTSSGVVALVVPASEHAHIVGLAGQRVQLRGAPVGASVAVSDVSPTVAAPATSASTETVASARPLHVAVVLLRPPGTTAEPVSKTALHASMFGAPNSVANWYAKTSGGQVRVTGTVYGSYDGVRSCDLATELRVGAAAASHHGYVASNATTLIVYTPQQACNFSGMAWIGAPGVFLNGTAAPGVIEHELGHNLGLLHAGAYECATTTRSAGCLVDYGDPTDVMGDPTLDHGYSAEHKYQLGWIPASEVRTVTAGTHTIALTAAENPLVAGSTELIHVRAADGTMFAIDRRASVGYDVGLSGVWIRDVAEAGTDDTELMRSTALPAGESFTDAVHRVTIRTLNDRPNTASASVEVCVGPCAVSVASQTVAVSARSISVRNIATAAKRSSRNASIEPTVPSGHAVLAGHTVIVTTDTSDTADAVSCTDSRGDVYHADVNSVGARRLVICSAHAVAPLEPGATITVGYPTFDGAAASTANQSSGLDLAAPPE